MKRIMLLMVGTLLALVVAAPMVYAQSDNGGAPQNASATYGPEILAQFPGHCSFPMQLELSGKGKQITLPDDSLILTSPGLDATITNLDNGEQATFNITGSVHQSTSENGDVTTVMTGRNFAIDPVAGTTVVIGRFSFVFDAEGNLIQPQTGTGQRIDVCELLS
jgi:hypothetical protein